MMGNVAKIAAKVGLVLVGSFILGYTEYRIKGGEPIRKLYKQVKAERLVAEAAEAAKKNGIVLNAEDGSVK